MENVRWKTLQREGEEAYLLSLLPSHPHPRMVRTYGPETGDSRLHKHLFRPSSHRRSKTGRLPIKS